jgi:hypothetical protein
MHKTIYFVVELQKPKLNVEQANLINTYKNEEWSQNYFD